MIVLSEITDNFRIVLGGAITTNQLQCVTSWRDRTSTTFVAGRTTVLTNNTTDVNLASAPASNTQRIVDFMSVYNADTVNATVTIKLNANGTDFILFKTTLATGETIQYNEGKGFYVVANSGAIKTSINQGNNTIGSSLTAVVLGSDVINNNAVANTMQEVTGLGFNVTAGNKYYFKFIIPYTAAATTTGSRWGVSSASAITLLSFTSEYTLTSTTSTRNAMVQAYDSPASSNASSVVSSNICIMEGFFIPTSNGSLMARFASEVSASAITAKAGAVCYYQRTL